jgi:amino acid adenylation domain-containing protein
VAAIDGDREISYAALDEQATALAVQLAQASVGPESIVGICSTRSIEMVIGVLGILKAGAAYLPLDPGYPPDRLAFMAEDANMRIVVAAGDVAARVPNGRRLISLGAHQRTAPHPGVVLERARAENLAYVIYTSGSTGTPKGICIEHRNAVALIDWAVQTFGPDGLQRVVASSSLSFDLSVFELFAPLSCGGCAVILRDLFELPSRRLPDGPLLVNTVPTVLAEYLRDHDLPSGTAIVSTAGETLPPSLAQTLRTRTSAVVYNLYGPAEDTTYSTAYRVRDVVGTPLPIGWPITGRRAYILDDDMNVVPDGECGEICLGGSGVTRGYLRRPRLTAERFVPDPFSERPGMRLYRSGDYGRRRGSGPLEFVGRRDHQVKIRGLRIEPGEAEAVLRRCPLVEEAAVVAHLPDPERAHLIAYVVPKASYARADARAFLAQRLPKHLVPAVFVELEALPRTPNGKLDRSALTTPGLGAAAPRELAPRTETERVLVAMWSDVLNVNVGATDNFFDLGGNSLSAMRVIARARDAFGDDIPLEAIFNHPTVSEFAEAVVRFGRP